jgi:Flp pilus assembly protein TadG
MLGNTSLRAKWRQIDSAGSAAVELAMVVLPVILIVLGTFDYFAATYEQTVLEGAARALAEYARNAPVCVGGLANPSCGPGISSLFTSMQQSNNSLSGASQTPTTYYTCADNTIAAGSAGPCNVGAPPDTRVLQYIQITVTEPWSKFFSWDPWSTTSPLTARMGIRVQ